MESKYDWGELGTRKGSLRAVKFLTTTVAVILSGGWLIMLIAGTHDAEVSYVRSVAIMFTIVVALTTVYSFDFRCSFAASYIREKNQQNG